MKGSELAPCMQNRELSWLKFNERVLEEANCEATPLLERFKFLSIFTSNLDEFFMVRVGSITDYLLAAPDSRDTKTGMTPAQQLAAIFAAVGPLYRLRDRSFEAVAKALSKKGIARCQVADLPEKEQRHLEKQFLKNTLPLLSPQIIDNRHPFPHIGNKQLNVAVTLRHKEKICFGIIPLPPMVERITFLEPAEDKALRFVLTEDLLCHFAHLVFDMYEVVERTVLCVTRNADIDTEAGLLDEDIDYRQHMKRVIRKRLRLAPVRLELQSQVGDRFVKYLCGKLHIGRDQVFLSRAPLDLSYCFALEGKLSPAQKLELLDPPFTPQRSALVDPGESMLRQALARDILLSYPFESMNPFLNLIKEASYHPSVLSIKITLYRIARQSKLAEYLIAAAENGKDVTVLMELRARFDEQNNIEWAQRLEEAGCHVIYGTDGYKVHSKICLITLRDRGRIRTITQIGTGNYNEKTARLYTDLSIITPDLSIGEDAVEFFKNMAMGNLFGHYNRLWVAPVSFKQSILARMDEEIANCRAGEPCGITIKCNSLTDTEIMAKLVEASQAGVKVQLIVRGICCLTPKVPGLTDNVSVVSIVGRFLEHSRIYCFGTGEFTRVYIGSGDMMTRNTEHRVEIACPIQDKELKARILQMVHVMLGDNVKGREQQADGTYLQRTPPADWPVGSQELFMEEAVAAAAKPAPPVKKTAWSRWKGRAPFSWFGR